MDNIGALPVRMDFHAARISTIFSPAFRRSWSTRSTLSRCHRAALPAFVRFLAKANDASVPPRRFQRNPRSVSSFGTEDEQHASIRQDIRRRKLPPAVRAPSRKQVGQVRRTTHNTSSRQSRSSLRRLKSVISGDIESAQKSPVSAARAESSLEVNTVAPKKTL
jgi:hypothetical protein